MNTIIVMMIWVGAMNGGPGTISGFETIAACEAAIPDVGAGFGEKVGTFYFRAKCIKLKTRLD